MKMLDSVQATFQKIEGTQEIRTLMRHNITAYRVFYGVPIMVTFTPNEKHSALIIRLSRTRASDPMASGCDSKSCTRTEQCHLCKLNMQKWGQLYEPELLEQSHEDLTKTEQDETVEVPFVQVASWVPDCDQRRKIVARDPLACVYGFHVLCRIALSELFGVHVCPNCPDCNMCKDGGCVDEFGSVAKSEGGIYGRADAYFGSIECQKCGALHLHLLLFLQCMHQHTSLKEIAEKIRNEVEESAQLVDDFYRFKRHVNNEMYHKPEVFEQQRDALENAWPLYEKSTHLLVQPAHSRDLNHILSEVHSTVSQSEEWAKKKRAEGGIWCEGFWTVVQIRQMMLQHHIHLPNDDDPEGARRPNKFCQTKSKPGECRGGFPHDGAMSEPWMQQKCAVACKGICQVMSLRASGKKNSLGATVGPRNNAWLNGTHPGLLYDLGCNSDTLLTYRLPVLPETHSEHCPLGAECLEACSLAEVMMAAIRAQRDQACTQVIYI